MRRLVFLVAVSLAMEAAALPAAATDAAAIYANRCSFCHGTNGKGDGPAGVALKPPPRDLTSPGYWESSNSDTIKDAITNGKPGTAMVAFKQMLSADEIEALVKYIETFKPSS